MISIFVSTKSHKIFCILLHNILHSSLIFTSSFEELILKQQSILLIADIGTDLLWISLDVYKYNSNLNTVLSLAFEYISLSKETPN